MKTKNVPEVLKWKMNPTFFFDNRGFPNWGGEGGEGPPLGNFSHIIQLFFWRRPLVFSSLLVGIYDQCWSMLLITGTFWGVSRKLVNKSLDFPASELLKAGHCCCLDTMKKQLANGTTLTDSELCSRMYERLSFWTNLCVVQNTKHHGHLHPTLE